MHGAAVVLGELHLHISCFGEGLAARLAETATCLSAEREKSPQQDLWAASAIPTCHRISSLLPKHLWEDTGKGTQAPSRLDHKRGDPLLWLLENILLLPRVHHLLSVFFFFDSQKSRRIETLPSSDLTQPMNMSVQVLVCTTPAPTSERQCPEQLS